MISESGELCQKKKVCCAKDDIKTPEPPGPRKPPPSGNATNCFLIFCVQNALLLYQNYPQLFVISAPEVEEAINPVVPKGKWPNMCGIYYKRDTTFEYLAGASLITPGILITAAHWVT